VPQDILEVLDLPKIEVVAEEVEDKREV